MNFWPSVVEIHPDNHVLHTFLSYNLSFPLLSPITSLIMPTNDGPILMDLLLAGRSNFKTTPDVRCSKIITSPTVNITVYNSLFQCCNIHRQLPGYLLFNYLTLKPSCRH